MNKKITSFLILIYILLEIMSFFNYTFFTFFNNYNVLFSFIVFFLIYAGNIDKFDKKDLYFTILLSIALIFSTLLNNGSIGSVLNIICLVLGIVIFSKISISNSCYKLIIVLLILLLGFDMYKSLSVYNTTLYYKNTDFNSNTIAQCVLYINMIIFLYFKKAKKNTIMLLILLVPCSIWIIVNTQSRGAALSYMLFIFLFLFRNSKIIKEKGNILLFALSILGTLFPIVYLNMFKRGINYTIPLINKSLYTGRETLWLYSYEALVSAPMNIFIGLGSNFTIIGQETLNLHNMFFALIVNFGIVIFFIIMSWLRRFIRKNVRIEMVFSLLPIALLSFFETTILWNAILVFILIIENIIVNDLSY